MVIYNDEIQHSGTMGMKWGVRRSEKKVNRLSRKIGKTINRFDKGKSVDPTIFKEHSREVRAVGSKIDKRLVKMNKYVNNFKAEPTNKISKMLNNPKKLAETKDLIAKSGIQKKKVSELRTALMDVKMDM